MNVEVTFLVFFWQALFPRLVSQRYLVVLSVVTVGTAGFFLKFDNFT